MALCDVICVKCRPISADSESPALTHKQMGRSWQGSSAPSTAG